MADFEKQAIEDMLGDAFTTVGTQPSSQASKQTLLQQQLGDEVQSAPSPMGGLPDAFGSPHISSPAPPLAAAPTPLADPVKTLNFEGAKAATPVAAQMSPPPAAFTQQPSPSPAPATPLAAPASSSTVTAATFLPASLGADLGGAAAAGSTASSGENVDAPIDYDTFVKETLLWDNRVRSAVYFVGGLLALYAVHSLFSTDVTLVTGVCWVLLAQAGLNFVRNFINPQLQARCTWQDSALAALLISAVTNSVKGAATLHDKHMVDPSAAKMLRIVVVLWGVSLAGRLAGPTALAATLWVLAFSLPKVYVTYKAQVDKVTAQAFDQAKAQLVKLDPKARAAIIVLPTFAAGYLLSSADLAVALLVLALYGRSLMAQAQVDKVNAAVAPVTTTVTKVGDTMGSLVHSAVVKYDLTPTPAKRKRE